MEREYIHRRGPGGPIRRPSRRHRPPWIVWVLLALALIVGIVFLVVRLTGADDGPEEGKSSLPPPSSLDSAPEPAAPENPEGEPTPEPTHSIPPQTAPDEAPEDMGSFMIADGTGYEYYEFSTETTNSYITAVDAAGDALAGSAAVYSLIVPTHMDITLPESYLGEHQVNSADQRKAIDDYLIPSINAMNPDIKTVRLFDTMRRHCDEYIYFGTDRTWTQLGAYYAYTEFCKAKGIQAVALDQLEKKSYGGFMGGFAGEAGEERFYSDTVEAYIPSGNTSLSFTDQDGESWDGWSVISDGDSYSSSLLYLIFAAGDQPCKVLENSDITDGSTCVVVQDSFGNFFIPFLTQHYQHVYVVDCQLYSGSVPELASEVGASDVILLNNVIMTSNSSAVEAFQDLF